MATSNTFFYALIIVGGLIAFFLFLRRGETCASCSENFAQKPSLSKESEYRKMKRKELGLYHVYVPAAKTDGTFGPVNTHNQPWPGYDKYSLYSTMVSPPNTDNYPYMDSPYNQVMNLCSSGCSDKKCLSECVLHTLAETLPPIQ